MHVAQTAKLDRVVVDGFRRGIPAAPTDDSLAAPFAEGGKARAIVELSAQFRLPAVFVDQRGRAFHASAEVIPLLGGAVDLRSGELVARTPAATERIRDVVSQALCAAGPEAGCRRVKIGKDAPVHLSVLDYPTLSTSQLLKAVIVIERTPGEHRAGIDALAALLGQG